MHATPDNVFTMPAPYLKQGKLKRTLLSDAIRKGVPKPEELEPGVLVKGAAHQIFTGPEQGKTWLALWLITNTIRRGQPAVFFDAENGKRIVSERLETLGVGDDVDDLMHYFDFPSLDMTMEAKRDYVAMLDGVQPQLIVFDSWAGFLAVCGLSEDSNTDVEEWANAYISPAKARGCTVVILDHVGHADKTRSRAASRKKDLVDIRWHLKKKVHFDRGAVGYIQLTRKKDREAWLPECVGFSVGGTEDGFVFHRSEGTVQGKGNGNDGLTPSAREADRALQTFGTRGATYTEWREATIWKDGVMGDSTFRTARSKLMESRHDHVRQDSDRYYSNYSS